MPSSVILRMCYEPLRRELMIDFRARRETYRYFDVDITEWHQFLEAESKGTYLNCVFKQKKHPFEQTHQPVRFSGRSTGDMPLEWGEPAIPHKPVQRVEAEDRATKATA